MFFVDTILIDFEFWLFDNPLRFYFVIKMFNIIYLRLTKTLQCSKHFLYYCHVLTLLSSSIPMPGEQSQYGIPILMTDERASQVSHSSWRTKGSHNKSSLIPGLWASLTRKTKRWALLTKTSYYSREPHIATLSIKLWLDGGVALSCFLHLF